MHRWIKRENGWSVYCEHAQSAFSTTFWANNPDKQGFCFFCHDNVEKEFKMRRIAFDEHERMEMLEKELKERKKDQKLEKWFE